MPVGSARRPDFRAIRIALTPAFPLAVTVRTVVQRVQRRFRPLRGATQRLRTSRGDLLIGGDIVVAIDDRPIATRDQMNLYLEGNKRVGDAVKLTVVRDGERIELSAVLGAR